MVARPNLALPTQNAPLPPPLPRGDAGGQRITPESFVVFVFFLDAVLLFAAGIISYQSATIWSAEYVTENTIFTATLTAWVMVILLASNCYRFNVVVSPLRNLAKLFMPFAGAFLSGVLIYLALFEPAFFNQGWLLKNFLIATTLLVFGRTLALYMLLYGARKGWIRRRVAVLGGSEQGKRLMRHLALDQLKINHVVGVFDDRASAGGRTADDLPITGSTAVLLEEARRGDIDDVIIALPWSAEERLKQIIGQLRSLAVGVQLGADLAAFQFPGKMSTDVMIGLPMIAIRNNPLSGWRRVVKGLEDRVFGLILTVLFAPVMVVIAIAIKLDSPGPAFFRQRRIGLNNREFTLYKFRSMTHVSQKMQAQEPAQDETVDQATRDDVRITRVGKLLRRTSLDELPQLFNVLQGTMSLVGPRPHAVDHHRAYGAQITRYGERHRIKPGMTGLAQVNGLRGETDTLEKMEYRIRYDLYYIENWSIFMDLEVLALTVFIGFVGRNAY